MQPLTARQIHDRARKPKHNTLPATFAPAVTATAAKVLHPASSATAAAPKPLDVIASRNGASSHCACVTDTCAQACIGGMVLCCAGIACGLSARIRMCKDTSVDFFP